jgi:hypothetical protein
MDPAHLPVPSFRTAPAARHGTMPKNGADSSGLLGQKMVDSRGDIRLFCGGSLLLFLLLPYHHHSRLMMIRDLPVGPSRRPGDEKKPAVMT